jgi:hypothetical protein
VAVLQSSPERTVGSLLDPNRVLDLCCFGFAGWTLSCHAVVLAGGSLDTLLVATTLVAAALALGWLVRPRRPHQRPDAPDAGTAGTPRAGRFGRRWAGAAAAAGLAVWAAAAAGASWTAVWALSAAVLSTAAAVELLRRQAAPASPGRARHGLVWALAVACALVTLTAHRPDIDDSLYVRLGQSAADEPSAPLLAGDPLHGIDGVRLLLPTYRTHSVELLAGGLARLTMVPVIAWLHLVFAPLAAVLAVLAIARVAALIAPRRALAVTAATVAILLVVGNAHAWYGNLAFVRLHQGKGMLATAVVPLIIAFGLELARRPSRRAWLRLAAVQVAAVGTTAAAMWIAPVVAVLAVACGLSPDRRGLKVLALAVAAGLYPTALAAGFWVAMQAPGVVPELAARGRPPVAASGGPTGNEAAAQRELDVAGHLERSAAYVLGDQRLRLAVLGLLLWGWWLSPEGPVRRLHLTFSAFTAVILVNPFLVERLATSVTGVATFWRIAWVVPVPLLAGCLLTAPLARVPGRRGALLAVALTAAALAAVTTRPVLGAANGTRLETPGLKVDGAWQVARALVERVPAGAIVVAPREVSPWITTFPHPPAPVVVRREYLRIVADALEPEELMHRIHATVAAREPGRHQLADRRLLALVDREPVAGVVIAAPSPEPGEIEEALHDRGFGLAWSGRGYRVWVRSVPPS